MVATGKRKLEELYEYREERDRRKRCKAYEVMSSVPWAAIKQHRRERDYESYEWHDAFLEVTGGYDTAVWKRMKEEGEEEEKVEEQPQCTCIDPWAISAPAIRQPLQEECIGNSGSPANDAESASALDTSDTKSEQEPVDGPSQPTAAKPPTTDPSTSSGNPIPVPPSAVLAPFRAYWPPGQTTEPSSSVDWGTFVPKIGMASLVDRIPGGRPKEPMYALATFAIIDGSTAGLALADICAAISNKFLYYKNHRKLKVRICSIDRRIRLRPCANQIGSRTLFGTS